MTEQFINYINNWKALDAKHDKVKIPILSFIYELWILNKKDRLTKNFTEYIESIKA